VDEIKAPVVRAMLAVFLVSVPVLGQEPPPIEPGVAPRSGLYAPGVDVLHYEVEVGLGRGLDWFEGSASVRVAVTRSDAELPLDLTGLEVLEVTVDGSPGSYRYENGVLGVALDGYPAGSEANVLVRYRGVPDDGLILRQNVHGEPSAFVDNWPNRTRFWLPSVDHPTDKATVRFTVHAPADWKVVANGRSVTEGAPTPPDAIGPAGDRRTWVWDEGVPISPYNMVIGAADLSVMQVGLAACGRAPASPRTDGCVEVTYWVYPEDVARAEPSFRRSAEMVDHFTDLIGPYPFEKLAHVQSATRFGGMENASAIFYSERAIASGANIEATVSHEIAHQWFGDSVTEADWHHLWLSEGFATYFGAQFFEAADGVQAFRAMLEDDRRELLAGGAAARPIYDPAETDLFALLNDNNYEKGAWVLHMLRGILGDEAFFGGVREYYRRYAQSSVFTSHFQAVMEEACGQDLDWFFRQWIYEPGYPVFSLDHEWEPAASGPGGVLDVVVRQTQTDAWPTFRVPTELLVEQDGRELRVPIEITERTTRVRVELDAPSPPRAVVLDPDGWVLKGP
jgi:aminopeptidase N